MATNARRRGELELVVLNADKVVRELNRVEKANLGVGKSADTATKSASAQQKGAALLTGSIKSFAVSLGAAATSYLSLEGAKKLMAWGEEAAKVRDLETAFTNFNKTAGRDSTQALSQLRTAVKGTISDVELMQRSNLLMMLEVPMDRVGDIAAIARNAALATGQDVSYMLESLSVALARQSKLWLDNLGIIVDADKAKAAYAKSVGKTVDALTEEESKLAFINAALDAGLDTIERSGGLLTGVADPYARLDASAKNLSLTLKGMLIPATAAVAEAMAQSLNATDSLLSRILAFWENPGVSQGVAAGLRFLELWTKVFPSLSPFDVQHGESYRQSADMFAGLAGPSETREEYDQKIADREQRRRHNATIARLAARLDELDAAADEARMRSGMDKLGPAPGGNAAELLTTFEEIDVDAAIENMRRGFETFQEFLEYKDAIGEAAGGIYTLANAFEYLGFQVDNYASVATESLGLAKYSMDALGQAYMNLWAGQAKAFPAAMQMIAKEAQARIAAIGAVAAIDALKFTYMGLAAMAQGLTFAQASGFFVAAGKAALVATAAGIGVAIVGNQISGMGGGVSSPSGSAASGSAAGGDSGLGGQVQSVNVTRTAPTAVTITHNYFGPVTFASQAASDAASFQEAIDSGDVVIPEREVA